MHNEFQGHRKLGKMGGRGGKYLSTTFKVTGTKCRNKNITHRKKLLCCMQSSGINQHTIIEYVLVNNAAPKGLKEDSKLSMAIIISWCSSKL